MDQKVHCKLADLSIYMLTWCLECGGVMVTAWCRSTLCHHQGGLPPPFYSAHIMAKVGGDRLQGRDRGHQDAGSVEGGLPDQQHCSGHIK